MQPIRKIIHIDMDAFHASVEQHDRPELKGKPGIGRGDFLFDFLIRGHTECKLEECLDFLDKNDLETLT